MITGDFEGSFLRALVEGSGQLPCMATVQSPLEIQPIRLRSFRFSFSLSFSPFLSFPLWYEKRLNQCFGDLNLRCYWNSKLLWNVQKSILCNQATYLYLESFIFYLLKRYIFYESTKIWRYSICQWTRWKVLQVEELHDRMRLVSSRMKFLRKVNLFRGVEEKWRSRVSPLRCRRGVRDNRQRRYIAGENRERSATTTSTTVRARLMSQ